VESGGQPGNRNSADGKAYAQQLKRALAHLSGLDYEAGLFMIAQGVVKRALTELADAKEVADRIDGKPPQAITGADGGPLVVIAAQAHDEKL